MQLPNRLRNMWSEKTRLYTLVGIILLPILASIVFLVFIKPSPTDLSSEEYFDPGSGETVSSPKNKTPEMLGTSSTDPIYLGFSKLINSGLTMDQLELVKEVIARFSSTDNRKITEISVTVDTINQNITDDGISLTFGLTANRTTKYLCTVSYTGLNDVTLIITDETGKQVFDSGLQQVSDLLVE